MPQINDVHRKIEDEFIKNLQGKGVRPAVAEELVSKLSSNKNPKSSDLLDFYGRHSGEGETK